MPPFVPQKLAGDLQRLETFGIDVRVDMGQVHVEVPRPLAGAEYLAVWFYGAVAAGGLIVASQQLAMPLLSVAALALITVLVVAPLLAVLLAVIRGVTPFGGRSINALSLTPAALRVDDAVIPWESIEHVEARSRTGGHDLVLTVDGEERVVTSHGQWTPMSTLRGVIARHAERARAQPDAPPIPAAIQAMRRRTERT